MREPLINILIRTTKGREKEFEKCIDSIRTQTYKNINIIVCTDDHTFIVNGTISKVLDKVDCEHTIFNVEPTGVPFHWNFYCNNLKDRVEEGWFFYLDDDDYLANPYCLDNIAERLNDPRLGVICQFNRGVKAKPEFSIGDFYRSDNSGNILFNGQAIETNTVGTFCVKPESIIRGKIGGSCIFLHHSHKDIAMWDGNRAADYRFIKAVSEKIPLKWVPIVVVQAGNKGRRGK